MAGYQHKDGKNSPHVINWYEGPKRRTKAFKSKREAIRFKTQMEALEGTHSEELLFDTVACMHIQALEMTTTLGHRQEVLRVAEAFTELFYDLPVSSVTSAHLGKFRDHLLGHYKPSTTKQYVAHAVSILHYAEENGYIPKGTCPKVKYPKVIKAVPKWINETETQILLDRIKEPKIKLFVLFLVRAGMRKGEVQRVKWSDIKDGSVYITFKGNSRVVPLQADIVEALKCYPAEGAYVFPSAGGDSHCSNELPERVRKYIIACGFPQVNLHLLRHSFASQLSVIGVSIQTISQLLGHRNIQTTMIYTHVGNAQKEDAIAQLGQKPKVDQNQKPISFEACL